MEKWSPPRSHSILILALSILTSSILFTPCALSRPDRQQQRHGETRHLFHSLESPINQKAQEESFYSYAESGRSNNLIAEPQAEGSLERPGRRKMEDEPTWQFLGATVPFLKGPTLAVFNSTFFRYEGVTPLAKRDWRTTRYMTPVIPQYNCASCWAIAAADTVAIASAIASDRNGTAPGVQQICDCSGMGCCKGGWPEDAMAWMVSEGNITTASYYNYWAKDGRVCSVGSSYPIAGRIQGWERVPMFSKTDLMKAVNMQPVLIYISASTPDFQSYRSTAPGTSGFQIYDGNCTSEINHAMVVVGYDTTGPVDYWILKNTWPAFGWGDNGFMYIVMREGPGKCGMQMVHPIFPTYFTNAPAQVSVDPTDNSPSLVTSLVTPNLNTNSNSCPGMINPCGSGDCYIQNGIARCTCAEPYVEVLGFPTSKCVHRSPCTKSMFNPCGIGKCMDYGDGSYICGCPSGYTVGTLVEGAPTCVPVSTLEASTNTYVARLGDTCARVQSSFNISAEDFQNLNPYIKCSRPLVPGIVVTLSAASAIICTQQYAIRSGDTCPVIAYYMDNVPIFYSMLNPSSGLPTTLLSSPPLSPLIVPPGYNPRSLLALNPALNCSRLLRAQPVCVKAAPSNASAVPLVCGRSYTTAPLDSCLLVRAKFGLSDAQFQQLNPAVNCNFNLGVFTPGIQVCVAAATSKVDVNCTDSYTVQQGDTCAQMRRAVGLTQEQLMFLNPGLQCQHPYLHVGLQICLNSPLLASFNDPSFELYLVQPNDTWATIQAKFSSTCQPASITIPRIADQNNITDWTTYNLTDGQYLIVPCAPKVGAACGCAASLPVCGADLITYNSYCDARCNFATPAPNGACSSCQSACAGRYGRSPQPASACPSNYVCPWPSWQPPESDASASFTTSPLCSYRKQTCDQACATYNNVNGLRSTDTFCYNTCMACQRVPCSGPSENVPPNSTWCSTCQSPGCRPSTARGQCAIDCDYFNQRWNPINP